jgi:Kef-type K+ transport system membrane component KefB
MISHVSIVFPFFLGVCAAYYMYPRFAPAQTSFLSFSLFMGIAMSITAFPVLARIVKERGLTGTPLGSLALTCAAADDITAWCLLAVVIAIVKANSLVTSLVTVCLVLIFICIMLYIVKPWVRKKMAAYFTAGNRKAVVMLVFITMVMSAWIAEIIGIHALFGSFLAGVIMPQNFALRKWLTEKVEDVSLLLLLPIFFASTGLRMQIGLIWQDQLWLTFALIMLVAVGGKFGGSALAARVTGETWRNSFAIGALMNTRGLMELVVLNIGYELGILSPSIFSLMVLMALFTTFMTGPLLSLFYRPERKAEQQPPVVHFPLPTREVYHSK